MAEAGWQGLGAREIKWNGNLYAENFNWIKGTAGSVVFVGTDGTLTQDNSNLFWDNTNNRLGLRTTTPQHTLTVVGASNTDGLQIHRSSVTTGDIALLGFRVSTAESTINLAEIQAVRTNSPSSTDTAIVFRNTKSGTLGESMRIDGNGNVGIGTASPNQLLSLSGGAFASNNTTAPTLTLSQVSGAFFISGGAFFYKGDKGTVTELAAR